MRLLDGIPRMPSLEIDTMALIFPVAGLVN
jgi:hypothetical protein